MPTTQVVTLAGEPAFLPINNPCLSLSPTVNNTSLSLARSADDAVNNNTPRSLAPTVNNNSISLSRPQSITPLSLYTVPTTQVVAVAGEPAYLPCDIATQEEDDAVLLVLWYKEDLGTPIYR
ncbi:unnamed protein product [Plutella xylostella]|uniref:(diamondback moth) hypothetical protein n=1 Tax=Plutella xylostella TaxID=51655 RepID=A0A8S4DWK3_PLUXY|nr:unnamed protein product [Plutella xylostella]